ncbi:hypothetical protein PR048_006268 [Dryococelus australis]|uniref:Uncharacterized protein n=1 Tax=Dryococelus australis TaxID=614101 RepID=A0ABQ9IAJ4_9NEOP|nr:hypothetical protein PR048_006268 [Dryococelus australis]
MYCSRIEKIVRLSRNKPSESSLSAEGTTHSSYNRELEDRIEAIVENELLPREGVEDGVCISSTADTRDTTPSTSRKDCITTAEASDSARNTANRYSTATVETNDVTLSDLEDSDADMNYVPESESDEDESDDSARQTRPLSSCRKKCKENLKLVPSEQDQMSTDYWTLGSFDQRVAFLSGLVSYEGKKATRKRKQGSNKERTVTHKYHINVRGKRHEVCKGCFKKIFAETNRFIDTIAGKHPSIDIRNVCDTYNIKSKTAIREEFPTMKAETVAHHNAGDAVYNAKKVEKGTTSDERRVYTFDLQQDLPTPLLSNTLDAIHHKSLVPGHTHMQCDVIHAMIEHKRKMSGIKIHLLRDWYVLVRSTGKKIPVEVRVLTREQFLNFGALFKAPLKPQKLMHTKEPGIVNYTTSSNEEEPFKRLSYRRQDNKKDLKSMIHLIDPNCRDFYCHLQESGPVRDCTLMKIRLNTDASGEESEAHDEDLGKVPDRLKENCAIVSPNIEVASEHACMDSVYLDQAYSCISKQLLRDNANMLVLFRMDDTNLHYVYDDHVNTDMPRIRF